jgi:hypothetical protein
MGHSWRPFLEKFQLWHILYDLRFSIARESYFLEEYVFLARKNIKKQTAIVFFTNCIYKVKCRLWTPVGLTLISAHFIPETIKSKIFRLKSKLKPVLIKFSFIRETSRYDTPILFQRIMSFQQQWTLKKTFNISKSFFYFKLHLLCGNNCCFWLYFPVTFQIRNRSWSV